VWDTLFLSPFFPFFFFPFFFPFSPPTPDDGRNLEGRVIRRRVVSRTKSLPSPPPPFPFFFFFLPSPLFFFFPTAGGLADYSGITYEKMARNDGGGFFPPFSPPFFSFSPLSLSFGRADAAFRCSNNGEVKRSITNLRVPPSLPFPFFFFFSLPRFPFRRVPVESAAGR